MAEEKSKEKLEEEGEEGEVKYDPKILETVDLTLPGGFEQEVMASEMLDHLANFKRAKIANQAARHSGDHQKAEQMYKLMAFSRLAVALIQSQFPNVKKLTDEIARAKVTQAKGLREQVLQQE